MPIEKAVLANGARFLGDKKNGLKPSLIPGSNWLKFRYQVLIC